MSSLAALEAQRDAILSRMEARRLSYRRLLNDGTDLPHTDHAGQQVEGTHIVQYGNDGLEIYEQNDHAGKRVMAAVADHPLLCALGVAAIVAIGPRRILRAAASTGVLAGALTAHNYSNMDKLGRLLSMAGAYKRSRSSR